MKIGDLNFSYELELFKEKFLKKIEASDIVYIVPHVKMDFDALAASVTLGMLIGHLNKECYIITNDEESLMEENVKDMYSKLKYRVPFINTELLNSMRNVNDNELLITVDTNKRNLVPIQDVLGTFNDIVIIDHHNTDDKTINSDCAFINQDVSSASEILVALLKSFDLTPKDYLAQCLLTGIYLDTGLLTRNFKENTALTVAELISLGADTSLVSNSFIISDFEFDRKRQRNINNLIDQTMHEVCGNCNFAVTFNKYDKYKVYTHEELAQAADGLLKYNFDAIFVIGYTDLEILGAGHKDIISIKGRSKGIFDVCNIVTQLGGGGTAWSGACEINELDIIKIIEVLFKLLKISNNIQVEHHPKQLFLRRNKKKIN